MQNKNGFVLLETLIVTVFIAGIFTFLYVSIIPLLGTYDGLTNENSIDVVYKLYSIRKELYSDANYSTIISGNYDLLTCNNLTNTSRCNSLLNILDISNYQLLYIMGVDNQKTNIEANTSLELKEKVKKYVSKFDTSNNMQCILILYDVANDQIAHLGLAKDLGNLNNYSFTE